MLASTANSAQFWRIGQNWPCYLARPFHALFARISCNTFLESLKFADQRWVGFVPSFWLCTKFCCSVLWLVLLWRPHLAQYRFQIPLWVPPPLGLRSNSNYAKFLASMVFKSQLLCGVRIELATRSLPYLMHDMIPGSVHEEGGQDSNFFLWREPISLQENPLSFLRN